MNDTPKLAGRLFGPLKAPPTANDRVRVALLDSTALLVGYELVEDWNDDAAGIPVEEHCDLAPLRFRWEPENKRFHPISDEHLEQEKVAAPIPIVAIANALIALRDGKSMPKVTLDWLTFFEKSMDNKGAR